MLSFSVTREDSEVITAIVDRAMRVAQRNGIDYDRMTAHMDLTATHANGMPLRLVELRDAPDFDFVHDVFGIRRHIDRETGQLGDCFCPRFARMGGGT